MSYEKQNFEDGQVLEAEHLNHMEDELARPKNWKEIEGKPFVTVDGAKEQIDPAVLPEALQFGGVTTIKGIMPETEVTGEDDGSGVGIVELDASLFTGNEQLLKIVFDGKEYICQNKNDAYGNTAIMGDVNDTGEPFLVFVFVGYGMAQMFLTDTNHHTVSIAEAERKKIDMNYLPDEVKPIRTILHENGDYLYHTEDTSDISNRVTLEQLREYFNTGKDLWVKISTANAYLKVMMCYIPLIGSSEFGYVAVGVLNSSNDFTYWKLYTAEYTAS